MMRIDETVVKTHGGLHEKVFQIGEGNFLRAFLGTVVERMNDAGVFGGSIVITPPRRWDNCAKLATQNCVYTVLERGITDGQIVESTRVVTSVSRCVNPVDNWNELYRVICSDALSVIVSNTTEAGIRYCKGDTLDNIVPASYPAKLTALLYARYQFFSGSIENKLLILPVELIEHNGDTLRKCVLQYAADWHLGEGFEQWLNGSCCFANTLVDRIVTGFPADNYEEIVQKLGYDDPMLTACEPFLFWAIECPKPYRACFPAECSGLDVVFCDDIAPYKTRKVRILNGAHTASVLAAFMCGFNTVGEMMSDTLFERYLDELIYNEIIPATDMDNKQLKSFAAAVFDRFKNPFIRHRLLDISLNSVSKFNARCKETLLDTIDKGIDSHVLPFSLAALIYFYKGRYENGVYCGTRGENLEKYEIRDSAEVCRLMSDAWDSKDPALTVLSNAELWGMDLSKVKGLYINVSENLHCIKQNGMRYAVEIILNERKI